MSSEGTSKRIAVIGAGVCGLCVLRHFATDPRYDVTAYEQQDRIGGIWNYPEGCEEHNCVRDETSPFYCRMYRNLRYESFIDYRKFHFLPLICCVLCAESMFLESCLNFANFPTSKICQAFSPKQACWNIYCAMLKRLIFPLLLRYCTTNIHYQLFRTIAAIYRWLYLRKLQ